MKLKQKVKALIISAAALIGVIAPLTPAIVAADCGGVPTSIINCTQQKDTSGDPTKSGVWGILILAINILTAGVGLAAIGGVIYAAVLYSTARWNQEQVKKAIQMLINVGVGVVAYALMWALLNFLIPGGVFKP